MARKKEIYTTAEVAKRFRVSEATVRRLVGSKKLRPIKGFNHPYRFSCREIDRFLNGRRAA
ncbi:helix-turn-helix domain-containing protein [Tichowtungia aerotolerans]|uniref:Helix-turn-helix domain-containing protein n=1 Tax=Tichowtungia aerotolerans TaxID=2697043 RepID=A0A6P1M8Y4_9BACT|nr:helix-turn-helix domain-containing protein [Tichowtungia aerotolerans]QHI69533.1 helix-turn-helix domain-containing protein [Tichowtungia aerotolerans]